MCGYVRRHIAPTSLMEFLALMKIKPDDNQAWALGEEPVLEHFYPAWGGDVERKVKRLLVREDGHLKLIDATWWFQCSLTNGILRAGPKHTFNARNLDLDVWRTAIQQQRGILVATGIGEAIEKDGKKSQFLVESDEPLLLGCLYQKFENGAYSCAVITRGAHPRFINFHDDAFPLMLPRDPAFLNLWLSDTPAEHPAIAALLDQPKIFSNLTVTPVKTYKDAKPVGQPVAVPPDAWTMTS
jgi:putative SOS response-associated peptidase YedK